MVPGEGTRPIPDRVKEALFNIIGPDIIESQFLDLFSGTGSVAIEALSRGASACHLVDLDRKAIKTIHENLKATGFESQAEVICADSFNFFQAASATSFDYVFIAPPQYQELWSRAVKAIDRLPEKLNPDAWVIAQIDPSEYLLLELEHLVEFDKRKYGNTLLVFYEFPGE